MHRTGYVVNDAVTLDEYRLLAEAVPQIIWVTASDGRAEFFNAQWSAYTGLSYEMWVGDGWQQAVHPEDTPRMLELRRATLANGELFETEMRLLGADGAYRWFLARSVAMRDTDGRILKWYGSCTDIDARKRAQNTLRFFAQAGGVLAESLDVRVLADGFMNLLVPENADYCQLFLIERGELVLTASAYADPAEAALAQSILARYPVTFEDPFIASAIVSRSPRIIERVTAAMRANRARNDEHRRLLEALNVHSAMCLPLIARGTLIGVLVGGFTRSNRRHTEAEIPLVEELAHRLALALDNARRYQVEHKVATAFQRALLPRVLPHVPGMRLSSLYIPAEAELQIGGDWFDAFAIGDGTIGLSIGDVTGHGLDAAIVMGEIRQAIRSVAIESTPPARVLEHVDRVMHLNNPQAIATAGFGIYNPAERTLTYASAGHPAPMVARSNGSVDEIEVGGLVLGLRGSGAFAATTVTLEPGSLVCFYTDGLTEFDRDAVEGERLLRAALVAEVAQPTPDPAGSIYRAVVTGGSQVDDTAILVLYIE